MPATTEPSTPTTLAIPVPEVVVRAVTNTRVLVAAVRFLGTVLKNFFGLQFSVHLGLRKITVVNVDHPLDDRIPFRPEFVRTYLDFIAYWIRPMGWIARRFGPRAFTQYAVAYLRLIRQCYIEAAEVYRAGMTTTRRPRYYRGRFMVIHLFDPHLLCVPSLHVMICVLTYTFYRRAFTELGTTPSERQALEAELFGGAVAITESVLFIKQHSVNCLPAALYAMTRITPEDVTPAEAERFIEGLFANSDLADAPAIREHILQGFEHLFREGTADDQWPTTVQRYVRALAGRA